MVPLMAIPMAHLITSFTSEKDHLGSFLVNALYFTSLAGLILITAGLPWELLVWLGIGGNLAGLVLYKFTAWVPGDLKLFWKYIIPIFGFYFNIAFIISPVNSPNIGTQIADSYKEQGFDYDHIVMVDKTRQTAKVRIAAYGLFEFDREENWVKIEKSKPDLIILKEKDIEMVPEGYELSLAAIRYKDLQESALFQSLARNPKRYYFAVNNQSKK